MQSEEQGEKDETWTDFQKNVGHHKCIKTCAIWIPPPPKKEDRKEVKNNLKNNDWKVPNLIKIKH